MPYLFSFGLLLGNLDFILSSHVHRSERRDRALFWLEKMGLGDAANRKPSEMSGGMRRRLAIACAFSVEPDLFFLDERFASLDGSWQEAISDELIARNQQGDLTVLMARHQLDPVHRMGARIFFLDKGNIRGA